jgi:hypothetical protein
MSKPSKPKKYPYVFHSPYRDHHMWAVVYKPGQVDWLPTWREAFDKAFTWARVSHVATTVMRDLP